MIFYLYYSSVLVGSAFGAFWDDPEGGFIKFAVKRASKQDQTLHMEGKLYVILYFRAVWKYFVLGVHSFLTNRLIIISLRAL